MEFEKKKNWKSSSKSSFGFTQLDRMTKTLKEFNMNILTCNLLNVSPHE